MTYVELPEAKTIKESAFEDCRNLARVTASKVSSVEANAFKDCKKLSDTNFPSTCKFDTKAFENSNVTVNDQNEVVIRK